MEFNPKNPVVQLCLQGMMMEEKADKTKATALFLRAWNEATNDFEKFLAAYYIARVQDAVDDRLHWLHTATDLAKQSGSDAVKAAIPSLYSAIAACYETSGNDEQAEIFRQAAASANIDIADEGPFYHGTRADLKVGDMLVAGKMSNYKTDLLMNHIYFTAVTNGAGLAAALANGEGKERVYIVQPTGPFENDPNVTNKKFPGNPTRSYRTASPLEVVGELQHWEKLSPEEIKSWKERLAANKGEIIN